MATISTKKVPKGSSNFYCESCDYTTSRYSQYARHLDTTKHMKSTFFNNSILKLRPVAAAIGSSHSSALA